MQPGESRLPADLADLLEIPPPDRDWVTWRLSLKTGRYVIKTCCNLKVRAYDIPLAELERRLLDLASTRKTVEDVWLLSDGLFSALLDTEKRDERTRLSS